MFNLGSTRIPRAFSAKQLSSQSVPSQCWCCGSSFWEELIVQFNVIKIVAASFEKNWNDDLGINNLYCCRWKKGYLNTSRLKGMDQNKQKWQQKRSSDPHVSECLIIETELLNYSLRVWASIYRSLWELLYGFWGTKWSQNVLWRKGKSFLFFSILLIISSSKASI